MVLSIIIRLIFPLLLALVLKLGGLLVRDGGSRRAFSGSLRLLLDHLEELLGLSLGQRGQLAFELRVSQALRLLIQFKIAVDHEVNGVLEVRSIKIRSVSVKVMTHLLQASATLVKVL